MAATALWRLNRHEDVAPILWRGTKMETVFEYLRACGEKAFSVRSIREIATFLLKITYNICYIFRRVT